MKKINYDAKVKYFKSFYGLLKSIFMIFYEFIKLGKRSGMKMIEFMTKKLLGFCYVFETNLNSINYNFDIIL